MEIAPSMGHEGAWRNGLISTKSRAEETIYDRLCQIRHDQEVSAMPGIQGSEVPVNTKGHGLDVRRLRMISGRWHTLLWYGCLSGRGAVRVPHEVLVEKQASCGDERLNDT